MFLRKRKINDPEIFPDEIFMDARNIPQFDKQQFEGRLEKPISKKAFFFISAFFAFIGVFFFGKIFSLQAIRGGELSERSEKNSLKIEFLLPVRAVISDRNGVKLVWSDGDMRKYTDLLGFSHILGYIGLPSENDLKERDIILMNSVIGKNGIEKKYEDYLIGTRGTKLVERDSNDEIISESVQILPQTNTDFMLAIDSRVQAQLAKSMESVIQDRGFHGGAGIIIDVADGEVLSMVSLPEFNSQIMTNGEPREEIQEFFQDDDKFFLNRAVTGLYAPGSIVKPFVALAALNEGIISPEKQIFSAGNISIPNPYFPDKKSVFYDWKAHGFVDMKKALAVSSDVYFYEIGGGFENQKGLGISRIGDYAKKFGFNSKTGIDADWESEGIIPTPEMKEKSNPQDPTWRIGDTYNASIGQGNFQVTPIEMAVYAASLANSGKIVQPRLVLNKEENQNTRQINIPEEYFKVVREGMRMAVTEGTASGLNIYNVAVAGKTGTAEVGSAKKLVNSWVIGFFPYEKPKYAFAVILEKGPYDNLIGASYAMRQLLDWMVYHTPEYLK